MHINAQCFKQRMKRKEVGIRRTHKFRPGDRSHTLRALTTVTYWDGAKFQLQGRVFFVLFFFSFLWWPPRTDDVPIENRLQNWWISKTHSLHVLSIGVLRRRSLLLDAHTCALNQIPRTRYVTHLGSVSRNSRELFVPEEPVVQLQSAFFERLIFLTCL